MSDACESLATTDAVIDFLGGNGPVGELVGAKPKAVSNWRSAARGRFPAETFLAFQGALTARGRTAPPRLWGMVGHNAPAETAQTGACRTFRIEKRTRSGSLHLGPALDEERTA